MQFKHMLVSMACLSITCKSQVVARKFINGEVPPGGACLQVYTNPSEKCKRHSYCSDINGALECVEYPKKGDSCTSHLECEKVFDPCNENFPNYCERYFCAKKDGNAVENGENGSCMVPKFNWCQMDVVDTCATQFECNNGTDYSFANIIPAPKNGLCTFIRPEKIECVVDAVDTTCPEQFKCSKKTDEFAVGYGITVPNNGLCKLSGVIDKPGGSTQVSVDSSKVESSGTDLKVASNTKNPSSDTSVILFVGVTVGVMIMILI